MWNRIGTLAGTTGAVIRQREVYEQTRSHLAVMQSLTQEFLSDEPAPRARS